MSISENLQHLEESLATFSLKWILSSYSEEELKILDNILQPYQDSFMNYPYRIRERSITFRTEKTILQGIINILKRSLEDMPLLINEFEDERMAFIKWRLTIGK